MYVTLFLHFFSIGNFITGNFVCCLHNFLWQTFFYNELLNAKLITNILAIVDKHKKIILEAMKHWEAVTCIRFRAKMVKDLHFIRLRSDTVGWEKVMFNS